MTIGFLGEETRSLLFDSNLLVKLRERLDYQADSSVIGFYDRSKKEFVNQTQQQFLRRAANFGSSLRSSGVEQNSYVLLATSTPEATLLGFLGAIFAGAIPSILPVRPAFDGREAITKRIREALVLLGADSRVVVESKNGKAIVPMDSIPNAQVIDISLVGEVRSLDEVPDVRPSSFSHVQLTSGSTGAGKGVAVGHSSVLANINALGERIQITPYDVIVSWLPLYHDMGLISKALMPLVLRADAYLMSPFDFLVDPYVWIKAMSEKRGTATGSPTFGYDLVTKKITEDQLLDLDLSSWKLAFCGAEPITSRVAEGFYEKFAGCGLRPEVFTPSYGLAEATLVVTASESGSTWRSLSVTRSSLSQMDKIDLVKEIADASDVSEVVALGPPVSGLEVGLVDQAGSVIESDLVCGEVVVRGSSVAAGMIQDGGEVVPFEGNLLHTGDVGFFENGELFIVERIKNIIIRNGQNYSSNVLEDTLAQLSGVNVSDVVVLDRDILSGTGLTGVVEVDVKADLEEKLQRILDGVDRFEPPLESVIFVKAGSLERTTSGKKRHSAVRQALLNIKLNVLKEYQVTNLGLFDATKVIDLESAIETEPMTGSTLGP